MCSDSSASTPSLSARQNFRQLGLTDDGVVFYDALETNDSAVKVLGEPTLKNIARELVAHVRNGVTIDWTPRESAQAQIRVLILRILRKYGYPPDKQEKATQTVLTRPSCFTRNGRNNLFPPPV